MVDASKGLEEIAADRFQAFPYSQHGSHLMATRCAQDSCACASAGDTLHLKPAAHGEHGLETLCIALRADRFDAWISHRHTAEHRVRTVPHAMF